MQITVDDLGITLKRDANRTKSDKNEMSYPQLTNVGLDLTAALNSLEKHYIDQSLEMTDGNESQASRLLNINHHTFRYRRKKLNSI